MTSNARDCSRVDQNKARDWLNDEKSRLEIADCFVTGDWADGEDAQALLDQVRYKIDSFILTLQ